MLPYLFGPGDDGQQRNPRVIAAWAYATAGDLGELRPPLTAAGRYSLRRLTELLEQPIRAGINPPALSVWHCSVHNHPDDPILSDPQWQHVAIEIVAAVGLAPHADLDAVRWVGIRHADSHIHIVATLVRQDGRTAWARNDYRRVQGACRELEKHYGLHRVGVRPTVGRSPTPAELNKAARQHRVEAPRDQLRRQVHAAAAAAEHEHEFLDRLRAAGLLVRPRTSITNPTEINGYAVALPDYHTAAGDTIWYSGTRLADDLTMPKLRSRWTPS